MKKSLFLKNEYIASDLYRYTGKNDFFSFVAEFFKNYGFRYMTYIRMYQHSNFILKKLGLLMWVFNKDKKFSIDKNTKIGYGFYIGHSGPVVINKSTVIGNNVNISQFVTIGSNDGKAAIIEDNVYIGPNVCIVEDVVLGENCTIGAGSVVTKSIPKGATAVGNYAKVINYNNPARYIGNKWRSSDDK